MYIDPRWRRAVPDAVLLSIVVTYAWLIVPLHPGSWFRTGAWLSQRSSHPIPLRASCAGKVLLVLPVGFGLVALQGVFRNHQMHRGAHLGYRRREPPTYRTLH